MSSFLTPRASGDERLNSTLRDDGWLTASSLLSARSSTESTESYAGVVPVGPVGAARQRQAGLVFYAAESRAKCKGVAGLPHPADVVYQSLPPALRPDLS